MKKYTILLVLLLLTLIMASCSPYADFASNDYSGETLNREMLESIASAIFTDSSTESLTEYPSEDTPSTDDTMPIVTEAYEQTPSESINEETEDEYFEDAETSATQSPSNTQEDTCYWTLNGEVWHKSSDCRYLKNSNEILSGTPDQAKEAGKQRACSNCYK